MTLQPVSRYLIEIYHVRQTIRLSYENFSNNFLKRKSGRYIKALMEKAGLKITVDAVGNTYGLWEGSDPSLGLSSLAHSKLSAWPQICRFL